MMKRKENERKKLKLKFEKKICKRVEEIHRKIWIMRKKQCLKKQINIIDKSDLSVCLR